jgi:ribosomal protein S10
MLWRTPLIEHLRLGRTPLFLLESKSPEVASWDLGYHHAKRGKPMDPRGAPDQEAYQRGYQGAGGPSKPKEHYSRHLFSRLMDIARDQMSKHVDQADERNRSFLDNPDSPAEHAPKWHQWGIATHTKMFGVYHDKDVQRLLQNWGVKDAVDRHMAQEIDGEPKSDLIKAGIALHDLGKFTHRQYEEPDPKGGWKTGFGDHEARSGELIRDPAFKDMLNRDYGLTDKQSEYIARCAELHFELGILRNKAKNSGGWSIAYVKSPDFDREATKMMDQHPDMALEMGLLYLGDSMAKTNIRIDADTDEEIESQHNDIEDQINTKLAALPPSHKFDPKLIQAAKQLPVNMAAARRYFELWKARQQPPERSSLRTIHPGAGQQ